MADERGGQIPGYTYGTPAVAPSPVTLAELERLKRTAQLDAEDERYLRLAGEVLADQVDAVLDRWRGVTSSEQHLAVLSAGPDGQPNPVYAEASRPRFGRWILDSCLRPYDQAWLDYQQEIGLRHHPTRKNQTDGVESAPRVPLRYLIAFSAVIVNTVRPFLAAKGHSAEDVEAMHRAWCKSVMIQLALWSRPFARPEDW
ncbi:MAG: protogloblin ApPgb [Chloroflexi bacterium]|nr:protogloblin ApPgb [Chloroflexota bacterium]